MSRTIAPTVNGAAAAWTQRRVAVLASGGLDSAILIGELGGLAPATTPVYVRFGLHWEAEEERGLRRFLDRLDNPRVEDLVVFEMPIGPVYGKHWSTTGLEVPGAQSPNESVFLPGRNLLLTVQAAIWCRLAGIDCLALGTLAANPFPDSGEEFFEYVEGAVRRAVGGSLAIHRPYAELSKREVMLRGRSFPLEETFSCIRPVRGIHCGACNKCAERRQAFLDAGLVDKTPYHEPLAVAPEAPCSA